MSLLEIFVALGVLGTIIVSSSMYFGSANKNKQKARLRKVQKSIAQVIRNAVKSPANIFYSIARYDVNPSLASCVLNIDLDSSDKSCSDAMNRHFPVKFAVFSITSQDGLSALQLSSGQSSETLQDYNPQIYYDINGKPCEKKSNVPCFFEVETTFFASCRDRTPTCERGASQIYISYEVRQKKSDSKKPFGEWKLPPYPRNKKYITMSPGQILGPDRYSECGSTAFDQGLGDMEFSTFEQTFSKGEGFYGTLTGYDEFGRPECECLYPFRLVEKREDSNTGIEFPVCELIPRNELTCESGAYLRGVNTADNKKSVICANALEAFDCSDSHESGDKCSEEYYIKKYIINDCSLRCVYLPDRIRTCAFSWSAASGISTQTIPVEKGCGSEASLNCNTHKVVCCKPKTKGN